MSAKRALVVDDSKSARAFLSRILERYEITVDAAESAEAAIDYLTRHKPDVIFMDHMMPGMDGFQAVQSIKNNPRTAAIPILMYTSQEGDLYLGQARALGAAGVLPKQIKQADVTRMLYQLRLVSDRRTLEQTTFAPRPSANESMAPALEIVVPSAAPPPERESANSDSIAAPHAATEIAALMPQLTLEIRAALDTRLQSEIAALRQFIGHTLDSHAERLQGDVATLLPAARSPDLDLPTVIAERGSWRQTVVGLLAVAGLVAAAGMSWLWWQQGADVAALRTDLAAAYAEVETLRARAPVVSPVSQAPVALSDSGAADGVASELSAGNAAPDAVESAPTTQAAPIQTG